MPMIPLDHIVPDPDNVRVAPADPKADADLLASVRELGVVQPIVVRNVGPIENPDAADGQDIIAGFMVVVGHRRYRAAKEAGLATIPAEVRDGMAEGEVRMVQLAENTRRAGMTELDVWGAVEAAAKAGLPDESIAAAMNRPLRQVQRFRALGSLHPDLQAHIRANPNEMPATHQLRVFCQAPAHKQADAFHASKSRNLYGHALWHAVAHILAVKRIPLRFARFDRKLYTGEVFGDLFADEHDTEQADDAELFLRLQREWMDDECGRRLKQGWADAVVGEADQYGNPKPPQGAQKYDYGKPLPDRLPAKAARKDLIYCARLEPSGEVVERLYEKAPEKAERGRGELSPLGSPPRTRPDGRDEEAKFFTNDGLKEVEKHKRRALGEALGEATPTARDLDVLVAVLAVLLREQVSSHTFGHGMAPSVLPLLAEDGRLDVDGKVDELVAFGRALAAYALKSKASLPVAELVGDFLRAPVSYPADPDALSKLKGPAVAAVSEALGYKKGAFSTQKKAREAINKGLPEITPEHLPVVGWRVKPKPAALEASRTGLHAGDDDPMARIFGEDCEDYPEPEAMADEQIAALLALPESLLDYTHDELRAELERRGSAESEVAASAGREIAEDEEEAVPGPTPASTAMATVRYIEGPDETEPQDVGRAAAPNEAALEAWRD